MSAAPKRNAKPNGRRRFLQDAARAAGACAVAGMALSKFATDARAPCQRKPSVPRARCLKVTFWRRVFVVGFAFVIVPMTR